MNNDNNSNNYVDPKKVDLNNANLNEASSILNQERKNIVSATLQANSSINTEEAKKVNNAIKIKKTNPIISTLIVLCCLVVGGLLIFLTLKYSKKFIDFEDKPTTNTTTKLTMHAKVLNYLSDLTKVRKFESSNKIIFLLPEGFDLVNNNLYYFAIDKTDTAVINQSYGTYTIVDEVLILDTNDKYEITEGGISNNVSFLNIYDDEYKYYYNKSENDRSLLLINGTLKRETSLYLTSNISNTNIIMSNYQENAESIVLSNGMTFNKVDNTLLNNNVYLTLG